MELPGRIAAVAGIVLLCVAASAGSVAAASPGALSSASRGPVLTRAALPPLDEHALLRTVAAIYHLDPALLDAIARSESGFDPTAVSRAGAIGLMQLMPATARRFGVRDPFDPVENALGAARFLNYLRSLQLARTGCGAPTPDMIAAYDAGEGAVRRYGGVPPYRETREYVRRVLWRYFLAGSLPTRPRARIDPLLATHRTVAAVDSDMSLLRELARLKTARALAASRLNSTRWPFMASHKR